MDYRETLAYIHAVSWTGSRPGLGRIEDLLHRIGDPQKKLRFVHVAGTNGKGSFCTMLSSVLRCAGYHVGMYTSPYVRRFNERMMIDGEMIADDELAALVSGIRPYADAMEDHPTEFELITAVAFSYFAKHACEIVVLEVGMGGRLDATNAISSAVLSVITGISLDHTAFLGSTIGQIATEKAGIIRPSTPVLFGGTDEEANEVISARAASLAAPYYRTDYSLLTVTGTDIEGSRFRFGERENLYIRLLGTYQPRNAASVITAVDLLCKEGYSIGEDALRSGLEKAVWHARFEVIRHDPLTVFDGGHNPEGVDAAIDSIKTYFSGQRVMVMTGVMRDKAYPYMAGRIAEIASRVFTISPDNPRALDSEAYAEVFRTLGVGAEAFSGLPDALNAATEAARAQGCPLVLLGSLYMYEEVCNTLENIKKDEIPSYHL